MTQRLFIIRPPKFLKASEKVSFHGISPIDCIMDPLFYIHHPAERFRSLLDKSTGKPLSVALFESRRANADMIITEKMYNEMTSIERILYESMPTLASIRHEQLRRKVFD